VQIDWRMGIGYGDFVTGLGYAHNAALKYDTSVQINFHWKDHRDHKLSSDDPETIIERLLYVYGTMRHLPNVNVDVLSKSRLSCRFINNLDEHNPVHGLWYSKLKSEYTNKVLFWRTKYNTFYPGKAKDPVNERWDEVVVWLENQGYEVCEVTYRTPISEVMELIRVCNFGIGYDGMVHQLFKYMWKPLIVMCERTLLNRMLIPQAAIESNVDMLMQRGVDHYLLQSNRKIEIYKMHHHNYINQKQNYKQHSLYNVECK